MGNNNTDFSGDKNPNYRHGFGTMKDRPKFYNSWQNMKSRCRNPNNPKYHRYGGRGIKVHEDWMRIEGFAEWALNNGWKEGLTLDRIDNDGDYEPKNCRWITMSENSKKKSTTKLNLNDARRIREKVNNGECQNAIAVEYNVSRATIWFILKNRTHKE